MDQNAQVSPRQRRVDRYLRAANLGTITVFISYLFYLPFDEPEFGWRENLGDDLLLLMGLGFLLTIICEAFAVFYVFLRRKTDEYTHAMWHSGTTYAFFAAIIWLIAAPWVEAAYTGVLVYEAIEASQATSSEEISQAADNAVGEESIVLNLAAPVILSAFFIGFQIKRFRGDV